MVLYEWRVGLLAGKQTVRLSGQGIWIGETVYAWSKLTDASFVRYQTRSGPNEEFTLWFGPETKRRLQWSGNKRNRAPWSEMLVAFADQAKRSRPDLTVRDGPDAREQEVARWIGLGVALVALTIMAVVLANATSLWGALAGTWIGLAGASVGVLIYRFYARIDPPPRMDWASFAAREGRPGELPAN